MNPLTVLTSKSLALGVALAIGLCCRSGAQMVKHDLAIRNVDVFQSQSARVLKRRTILIDDDLITAIVDASSDVLAAKVIEGRGRLVVPGFIDTHVHLMQDFETAENVAPATLLPGRLDFYRGLLAERYLAHGTTTIMDLGQPEAWMRVSLAWQQDPSPDYPNLFFVGASLNSDLDWDTEPPMHHVKLSDPASARAKVLEYADLGVDGLKLYWKLEQPEMEAIVDAAQAMNLPLFAHIDNGIGSMTAAMDLGVKNFEHFFTLIPGMLNFHDYQNALDQKYGISDSQGIDEFAAKMTLYFDFIKERPELELDLMVLLERFAEEGCTLSTALNVLASACGRSHFFTSFSYYPERTSPRLPSYTAEGKKRLSKAFDSMMFFVKAAHEMGVKLRIGTDSRGGGEALLSELMLLTEAGIGARDVLRIATWNGAKAMGIEDQYASIEPGKKADLVIFESSPLEKPKNFLSKKTIIKGGKLFQGT